MTPGLRIASLIDHTLLTPEATAADVRALAREANLLGTAAACVLPSRVKLLAELLDGPAACAVVGFPTGGHQPVTLATEAAQAVADGAAEIDMVLDLGAVKDRNWGRLKDGIAAVRAVTAGVTLKVIVEAAALSNTELLTAALAAAGEGADFVKTSTGVHPAGGSSVEAIQIMSEALQPRGVRVKASGGIRTLEQAKLMVAAGADRLGVGWRTTASIVAADALA